jgi:hypothetical protein
MLLCRHSVDNNAAQQCNAQRDEFIIHSSENRLK